MKFFGIVMLALVAITFAAPAEVEVEERQMEMIMMVINMLKGVLCNGGMGEEVVERGMLETILEMAKTFLCSMP